MRDAGDFASWALLCMQLACLSGCGMALSVVRWSPTDSYWQLGLIFGKFRQDGGPTSHLSLRPPDDMEDREPRMNPPHQISPLGIDMPWKRLTGPHFSESCEIPLKDHDVTVSSASITCYFQ